MATAYRHQKLGSIYQVNSFARQRLHEINKSLEELGAEKEMWQKVIEQLAACPKCLGEGTVMVNYNREDYNIETCPNCKGSGKTDSSPPSFPQYR